MLVSLDEFVLLQYTFVAKFLFHNPHNNTLYLLLNKKCLLTSFHTITFLQKCVMYLDYNNHLSYKYLTNLIRDMNVYRLRSQKSDCDGRESNPGQLLGRQLC